METETKRNEAEINETVKWREIQRNKMRGRLAEITGALERRKLQKKIT